MKLKLCFSALCAAAVILLASPAAYADSYDLSLGSISIDSTASGQTVVQNGKTAVDQAPVITQKSAEATQNTISVHASSGSKAVLTLDGVNIDTSSASDNGSPVSVSGSGSVKLKVNIPDRVFYGILGEKSGFEINGEGDLLGILTRLADVQKKYEKVAEALDEVERTGYGIVTPTIEDLSLEEPEIVKQAGGYGVRLKASAPSVHMVRVPIRSEVSPIVGTERQSEELVQFLLKEFEEDPQKLWESNMFGKTLHELVSEGLTSKLSHMPEDARTKISETLEKIINEGSGGLICILL